MVRSSLTAGPSPARTLALDLLVRVRDPQAPGLDALLEDARRQRRYAAPDLALAREIAWGVCRKRRWLEVVLSRYLERPLPTAAFHVHFTLLMGLYQALYLDRIPAHTIADESVRLVGMVRTEVSYRKLVNAIMRRVLEAPKESHMPPESTPWPVLHSVPDWLASEAGQVYRGAELREFFAASNQPAPLVLRSVANPVALPMAELAERLRMEALDTTGAVCEVTPGQLEPQSLHVRGRALAPEGLPLFTRGLLTAEDEGGQVVGSLAGPRAGDRILDLCASPGGKSAHLADLTGRAFERFIATDVSDRKLARLRETFARLGLADRVETRLSTDLGTDLEGTFDVVLVDAPCSGLGTLRRHPEIRWRRRPEDLRALAKLQGELLELGARFVRPGGRLIYSVCTFTMMETDEQADKFSAAHAGRFTPTGAPEGLPFDEARLRVAPGRWRTSPHRDGCDAFFVARWVRNPE